MANSNDWGKIYCHTWWGDTANTTDAIPDESAPLCWADIVDFTVDTIQTLIDTIKITIDKIRL